MSNLGGLLSWSIENSVPNADPAAGRTQLNPELLQQLFGNQKDDATVMRESMAAIQDPEVSLEDKEIAFDNFEMLIEQLDNANNIEKLKLWGPLISLLSSDEQKLRFMAAWCCGTAVQNNPKSQEAFQSNNGVPKLVELALKDPDEGVRKKAVYALSSQVRNMESSLRTMLALLPEELVTKKDMEATNMEGIDALMTALRERVSKVISQ